MKCRRVAGMLRLFLFSLIDSTLILRKELGLEFGKNIGDCNGLEDSGHVLTLLASSRIGRSAHEGERVSSPQSHGNHVSPGRS